MSMVPIMRHAPRATRYDRHRAKDRETLWRNEWRGLYDIDQWVEWVISHDTDAPEENFILHMPRNRGDDWLQDAEEWDGTAPVAAETHDFERLGVYWVLEMCARIRLTRDEMEANGIKTKRADNSALPTARHIAEHRTDEEAERNAEYQRRYKARRKERDGGTKDQAA